MKRLCIGSICLVWLTHSVCADSPGFFKKPDAAQTVTIPWEELDERVTAVAKQMMEKPTLVARGPAETFACMPEQYFWLLDNPDRAVAAWRRLGAKCVSIERRGKNKFAFVDDTGSDVTWETVHQTPNVRIWLAEGKVKPSAVLPLVPVKALIILRHQESKMADGQTVMNHQAEVVIHTDSKAAAAVTKMMGQTAPKLAEQGLGQLQLFFAALSCFIERHPERVELLFRPEAGQAPAPNPLKH